MNGTLLYHATERKQISLNPGSYNKPTISSGWCLPGMHQFTRCVFILVSAFRFQERMLRKVYAHLVFTIRPLSVDKLTGICATEAHSDARCCAVRPPPRAPHHRYEQHQRQWWKYRWFGVLHPGGGTRLRTGSSRPLPPTKECMQINECTLRCGATQCIPRGKGERFVVCARRSAPRILWFRADKWQRLGLGNFARASALRAVAWWFRWQELPSWSAKNSFTKDEMGWE